MSLSWVATDSRTGRLLAEFPDLSCSTVSVVMGAYTSTTAALPLPGAPGDWERATLPGGATLHLLDGDVPLWGGEVTRRERGLGDTLALSLATAEAYLDRRYVGDATFTATSQTQIAADLVTTFATGWPVVVEASTSTVLRDRTYEDVADKTLYSALVELSGVQGGPEWTISWRWEHSPERLVPVLQVADRLGSAVRPGLGPGATFEAPGSVVAVTLAEDYAAGRGATDVMAVSTGAVGERPQSPHQVQSQSERPPHEHRFSPSSSITEVSTLTGHAAEALSRMSDGATSLTLTATIADAPRLGVDWRIGDDIGYRIGSMRTDAVPGLLTSELLLTSPSLPTSAGGFTQRPVVPAFPRGLEGVARCIGWEMSLDGVPTVAPILAMED